MERTDLKRAIERRKLAEAERVQHELMRLSSVLVDWAKKIAVGTMPSCSDFYHATECLAQVGGWCATYEELVSLERETLGHWTHTIAIDAANPDAPNPLYGLRCRVLSNVRADEMGHDAWIEVDCTHFEAARRYGMTIDELTQGEHVPPHSPYRRFWAVADLEPIT